MSEGQITVVILAAGILLLALVVVAAAWQDLRRGRAKEAQLRAMRHEAAAPAEPPKKPPKKPRTKKPAKRPPAKGRRRVDRQERR